jgi:hypothetical protein
MSGYDLYQDSYRWQELTAALEAEKTSNIATEKRNREAARKLEKQASEPAQAEFTRGAYECTTSS